MTTYRIRLAKRASTITAGAGLSALLGIGSAEAYSGFGNAVVKDRAGMPCFGLPARVLEWIRSPRALHALTVSAKGSGEAWSFSFPANLPDLPAPAHCIVYGELPASARLLEGPHPLIPGTLYEVYLNAPTNGPIRGYIATFCLKPTPDGSTRVIPVRRDAQKGWSADACQS
nr:hypothetical protein [Stenotrophomonas geniculata]